MENTKIVKHPKEGHVSFTRMTIRQKEVITAYNNIIELVGQNPNDADLGEVVRALLKDASKNYVQKE